MKFVYVITSSENDYYLEQAIISMKSLLLHNPNSEIIMLTDERTNNNIDGNRKRILEYISNVVPVTLPKDLTPLQRSRFLKTSLTNHIKGDFWFIDTDTVIADEIPEIRDEAIHVAAVLDKHLPLDEHSGRKQIKQYANLIGWDIPKDNKYFNSGVIFVRDSYTSRTLFNHWHEIWLANSQKYKIEIDQPSLAKANASNNYVIQELSGTFNCQVLENGLKYLHNAKIIHYFASSVDSSWECPYKFRDKELYNRIRRNGITPEIEKMILNAKSEFISKCNIIGGIQSEIYGTPLLGIAKRISRKYPIINIALYHFFKSIGRI